MSVAGIDGRPFYHEFAWAYDALIARPVADECAGMAFEDRLVVTASLGAR
jgi:hypothetical protein